MIELRIMEPLASIKKMMTWLYICPDESLPSYWKILFYICSTIAQFTVLVSALTGSVLFAIKFFSINLIDAMSACMQLFGWTLLFYMFSIALIMRQKISTIFTRLAEIYDESKYFSKIKFIYLKFSFKKIIFV